MAFALSGFNQVSSGANTTAPTVFSYITATDTLATASASAYFNSLMQNLTSGTGRLKVADVILIQGSDNAGFVRVTAVTTNVTVEDLIGPGDVTADDIALAQGSILIGAATGRAVALDGSTDTQILVGNGTTMTSVAVSGDATLANTGALTIAAGAVEESMLVANSLTGLVAANVADVNVIGGIPVVHRIATAGGATANTDVTLTHKTRVIYVWTVNKGLGTASDTIQVLNATNAITDAIDINIADTTKAEASTYDDAYAEIAAGGTLRVTETDGGGSDSPAVDVYVLGLRVA